VESEGKPPEDAPPPDATQIGEKREENAKPRGRPFTPGNQAAVGHGRPKKDFDLVTRCQELTPDIIEHYGARGAVAETGADVEMGKVVVAYGHGRPKATHEHTGPGGGPIQIAAVRTTEQKRARLRELERRAQERMTAGQPPALPAAALEGDDQEDDEPPEGGADGAPSAE